MSGLVTCDMLGSALIQWLNNATELQKDELCTALGCNDGALDSLLSQLRDCEGASLEGKRDLATCDDLAQATELNQGADLPSDASDCDRPLSACGLMNILNGEDLNPLQQAVYKSWLNTYVNDTAARNTFLSTLISPLPGNRIEVRDGGIGVWDEAPPNLVHQFVDSAAGDDSNPGSEAAPLRTLKRAYERIGTSYGHFTIFLKAGQTFPVEGGDHNAPNADIGIVPYDDPTFGSRPTGNTTGCPYYRPVYAQELERPTILVGLFYPEPAQPHLGQAVASLSSAGLTLVGVVLERTLTLATYPARDRMMINGRGGNVFLDGVIAKVPIEGLFSRANFSSRGSNYVLGNDAAFIVSGGSTLTRVGDYANPGCSGHPNYTPIESNLTSAVTPTTIGVPTDIATKTIFGASTNWDIFA